jgi:hypothetical protein
VLGDETGSEKLAVRGAVRPNVATKRHCVRGENHEHGGAMLAVVRVRSGRPVVMIGRALQELRLRVHRILLRRGAMLHRRRCDAAKRHQGEQQNEHGGFQQSIHGSSWFTRAESSTPVIALYVTDCYRRLARH